MVTDTRQQLEREIGDTVETGVSLSLHTTLKVGGVAHYFYTARTTPQLIAAVRAAHAIGIPWQVLGSGSNVLISDKGFSGLVIQNRTTELTAVPGTSEILVASGVPLTRLIVEAANRDLAGLEPLFGIPATVGGALYGNVEAHGTQFSQFARELTLYKPADDAIVRVAIGWLQSRYRSTQLKEAFRLHGTPTALIVMAKVTLMRRKRDATLEKIREYDQWRRVHQPVGTASCGSVFRNPSVHEGEKSGYLLEQSGAKLIRHGQASVSARHANFVVNEGGARADDVRATIYEMQERVRAHTGVQLQEEIEYIGDWSPTSELISASVHER